MFYTIVIILLSNLFKNFNFNFEFKLKNNLDFIFLFFVTSSLSIIIAHDLFLSHDVRLYWIEKALLFYNDFFIIDDQTIKPEYPHYGTYLWGSYGKLIFRFGIFWKNCLSYDFRFFNILYFKQN